MHPSLIYNLVLSFLSVFYLFLILFFIRGIKRLKPGKNTVHHSFSVVIAARNEEAHISRCLNSVLAQDYPLDCFEVIVVNDRSVDNTPYIVESYLRRRSNLKLVNVTECPENVSPKKNALARGILQATGEVLLFTDADCVVPRTWIRSINGHFLPETAAVAGLTTYFRPGAMPPFFWGLQAMDFFSHAVVAAAAIGAGFPLNTNANNFAVRRSLFQELEGFNKVSSIVSGDDDLILQAVAKEKGRRIRYAPEKGAAVQTEPTPTLKGIWEQRKRWSSKTVYYNKKQALVLSGVFVFYCAILAGFLLSVFKPAFFPLVAAAFVLKTLSDFTLAFQGMKLFEKKELLNYFLPLALVHIPAIVFSCLFGVFGRFVWKDGAVKKRLT